MPPNFPQLARMEARHDGCPNQFDYSANYHQTAEWRSKTAKWALDHAQSRRDAAEEAEGVVVVDVVVEDPFEGGGM